MSVGEPTAGKDTALDTSHRTTLAAGDVLPADVGGLPPDRRIGAYSIHAELGRGGMGVVYLATRADQQFEKRVAIKLIHAGAGRPEVLERFRRERQILASLDHPNIAQLLDGGTTEAGLPYIVMEHIEGATITDYCDERRLGTRERLGLFRTVCSAVEYAHRNLVVHRDIKPGNILVTHDGVPHLLDFGIAKLIDPDVQSVSATAMAMTPAYASPEQVRGEQVTTASDVYSLGVLLYELLTGRHPYRLNSTNPLELLKAICHQEVERPSTAVDRPSTAEGPFASTLPAPSTESLSALREPTPERLRHLLRGDLDSIVMVALRKEAAHRYASVAAFSEDIARYLDGRPVTARKGTAAYRAGKFLRRNRWRVWSAAAVLVLATMGAVNFVRQSARVARERDKAERVSRFLVEIFRVSDPGENRGNTITAREVLDKGAERVHADLKEQPEVKAALLDTIGTVYDSLGLYDKALPLLQESLALRRGALQSDDVEIANTLNRLGNVYLDKGDARQAEVVYREALAIRRKRLEPQGRDVAESLNNLASALDTNGKYDESETLLREALAIKRRLEGEEQSVATTLLNIAVNRARGGDWEGADAHLREALALQSKTLGGDHPEVAFTTEMLAVILDSKGSFDEAEALHRQALALQRKVLGDEHADIATTLVNLGNTLLHKGDASAAEPFYRESLAMSKKFFGEESNDVAAVLSGLAGVAEARGDLGRAEALCRESLAIRSKLLGTEHADTAESQWSLAEILRKQRKWSEAEAAHREALAARRAALPSGHEAIGDSLLGLGRTLAESGRPSEAEAPLTEALRILRSASGKAAKKATDAERALATARAELRR
jgi:serine/threonine-protein kinase